MEAIELAAAALVVVGVPFATAVAGAVMGSLLNATLTARAAKRELEEADQHDILSRLRDLELEQARQQGRGTSTTTTTTERTEP